jgi:hypothetical protein
MNRIWFWLPLLLSGVVPLLFAASTPAQDTVSVSVFASRLTDLLGSVNCRGKKDCAILVPDFVSPEGYSSSYGTHLADELAAEFARQRSSIPVVDRALLEKHLQVLKQERVPAGLERSPSMMRWLGQQVNASLVLVGVIEGYNSDSVKLSAHFLSVKDEKLHSSNAGAALPLPVSPAELAAVDPLPPLPPPPATVNGEPVYRAGKEGVGMPKCHYMPNPPYTDQAREFRLSGSLVIEGIVDKNGTIRHFRVVRGLPFGLNEMSARTMTTWKCDPATFEGQPVSTYVPFEITFRLY